MTKLDDAAFDYADKHCDCAEGEWCTAGELSDAFLAGAEFQRTWDIQAVMDLLFAVKSFHNVVKNTDLVKLAKRIKRSAFGEKGE